MIKDLNMKVKIANLEENMEVNLYALGFGNGFLDIMPKAKIKEKIVKLDFTKIKTFMFE